MISTIDYDGFGILIVLEYSYYMRELVAYSLGSLPSGKLNYDSGRYLYHGIPHDYMVEKVLVYLKISIDVALVLIEPLVDALCL